MKILVADDDPLTLEALSVCLEQEGFQPMPARNGEEALERWREDRPQMMCLDIMMPGMDGFEVCRHVRKRDTKIPILFLSAKNEEADVIAGLGIGADDFIRKPFTRGEVMARIHAALRRAGLDQRDDGIFTMGDLAVNPECLHAERGGVRIPLTAREVRMLALLHRKAGLPVSRDAFLDECWGLEYFPDSRTLDQHILNLRKKVEKDPARPVIVGTVRGVGYRFEADQ